MSMSNTDLDAKNAAFWDELCGSSLAQSLGITDRTPESIRRFDAAYLDYYPYLSGYVDREGLHGKKVLEIGLGFGTLGQLIAARGAEYYGLDIAEGPVRMMRTRLEMLGQDPGTRVVQGSALEIPHPEGTFSFVYSIGCLHHTGALARSVSEVHRVLAPGGKAVIMLYNANSFRQLVQMPLAELRRRIREGRKPEDAAARIRGRYDANTKGEAAPHVEFTSKAGVRRLFSTFADVRIDVRNFDDLRWRRIFLKRAMFLGNLARIVGLDLYVVARKRGDASPQP
jgi:SAM-dependent methyltransferase